MSATRAVQQVYIVGSDVPGGGGGGGVVDQGSPGSLPWLVDPGPVDQGAPGATPWPVDVLALPAVTQGPAGATPWPVSLATLPAVTQGPAGATPWPVDVLALPAVTQGPAGATPWPVSLATLPAVTQGPAGATPWPVSLASGSAVDTELPAAITLNDAMSNPVTPLVGACLVYFDAAGQWKRLWPYAESTVLSMLARTTSIQSGTMTNQGSDSGHIVVAISTGVAGFALTLQVQGFDVTSASWYVVYQAPQLTAAGIFVYSFGAGWSYAAAQPSGIQAAVAVKLPRRWRVNMGHANSNSVTYSVGSQLMP